MKIYKLSEKIIPNAQLLYVNAIGGGNHRIYSIIDESISNISEEELAQENFIIVNSDGTLKLLPVINNCSVQYRLVYLTGSKALKYTKDWLKYEDNSWLSKNRMEVHRPSTGKTFEIIAYSYFNGVVTGESLGIKYSINLDNSVNKIEDIVSTLLNISDYVRILTTSDQILYIPFTCVMPPHVSPPFKLQIKQLTDELKRVLLEVEYISKVYEVKINQATIVEEVPFVLL
jgi:hypothetical protein